MVGIIWDYVLIICTVSNVKKEKNEFVGVRSWNLDSVWVVSRATIHSQQSIVRTWVLYSSQQWKSTSRTLKFPSFEDPTQFAQSHHTVTSSSSTYIDESYMWRTYSLKKESSYFWWWWWLWLIRFVDDSRSSFSHTYGQLRNERVDSKISVRITFGCVLSNCCVRRVRFWKAALTVYTRACVTKAQIIGCIIALLLNRSLDF